MCARSSACLARIRASVFPMSSPASSRAFLRRLSLRMSFSRLRLPADCPVRLVARATGAFERVREHPPDTRVAYAQLVLAVVPAESVV